MNFHALIAPVVRRLLAPGIAMRASQFERLRPRPGCVLFLGDSITEGGEWQEWFPELDILNRGIGGDSVPGVRARLDTALADPVAVSLLVGTNDLSGLGRSRDPEKIAAQFDDLVTTIRAAAPDAALFINSVMPRTKSLACEIRGLNERYAAIASAVDATYVDLWPALAAPDGALRKELTRDNVHLNGPGYEAWVGVLRPLLAPFATNRVL